MDAKVKETVLGTIQSGFPIAPDPYGALAEQLGFARDEVEEALLDLREEGLVRRIGASFDSKRLGYSSTLCALAVPPERADEVAKIINAYPGVTHNYLRENRYNIWFTLITRSAEDRTRILGQIVEKSGCDDLLDMPATKMYKIRVDFGKRHGKKAAGVQAKGAGGHAAAGRSSAAAADARAFGGDDAFDVALVRWAQDDVAFDADGALVERPFEQGAALIGRQLGREVTEDEVIDRILELKALKVIRRFGAMVKHQKMGFAFNGMTVWNVDDDRLDEVGAAFAEKPYVSHCYTRLAQPTWPYKIYAMTHAQTQDELDGYVAELADIAQAEPLVLVSTKEYKKVSMRYFEE
ncbi:MAG: hypothetical protein ACI362_00105 [Coriobacteriales bacterium]